MGEGEGKFLENCGKREKERKGKREKGEKRMRKREKGRRREEKGREGWETQNTTGAPEN